MAINLRCPDCNAFSKLISKKCKCGHTFKTKTYYVRLSNHPLAGFESLNDAKKHESDLIERDKFAKITDPYLLVNGRKDMTFAEYIDSVYIPDYFSQTARPKEDQQIQFFKSLLGHLRLDEIREPVIRAAIEEKNKHNKPSTKDTYIKRIRHIFQYAVDNRYLLISPITMKQSNIDNGRMLYLTAQRSTPRN